LDAQIDLSTGEVVEKQYAKRPVLRPPREADFYPDIDPPWVRIPPPKFAALQDGRDRSHKKVFNSLKMYLEDVTTIDEAFEVLPQLEPIVAGALSLDLGGNARPIRPKIVFWLLKELDWITSQAVQNYLRCSKRHAQKAGLVLRIVLFAFNRESEAT